MSDGESGEPQVLSWTVDPGTVLRWHNRTSNAQLWRFQCGEYGEITVTVPIGGMVELRTGTVAPTAILNDAPINIADGNNVVRINDQD